MWRDWEKKHYNSLDREQDNIEDMDYSWNMNGKLEASEVLSYFVEWDKYFSTESRVNSILAETDPEKRREKIRKEVKKFFKNVFWVKSPEVATFFVQYVTEHMNLEDDKKEVTNEVLQEIRALLGKEFGDIIPHKSQEKYMDSAWLYLKKKWIGDFEKPW